MATIDQPTRAPAAIRAYDPATDAGALRACYVELQDDLRVFDARLPAGEAVADAYLARMLERCATWDGSVRVAIVDGDVVGFVCVWARVPPEPDEPTEPYAFISDVFVRPAHRGRGIGRALVDAAVEYARAREAAILRLDVLLANGAARRLYERAGFAARLVEMAKPLR